MKYPKNTALSLFPRALSFFSFIGLLSGFLLFNFSWTPSFFSFAYPEEICDNAIDDDGDGLIDLNDPDCECSLVEVVSLIPNPSFEDKICCPSWHSQLFCSGSWIQASEATTDFLHTCGWLGWPEYPTPLPFPDGDGAIGFRDGTVGEDGEAFANWKEYAGACLNSPLLKDTLYRFEFHLGFIDSTFSPLIEVSLFGTPDCQYLPFGKGDPEFGCPTNGPNWERIVVAPVRAPSGGRGWTKSAFEFTPTEDIYAIAIGPSCPAIADKDRLYYLFDNLILSEKADFNFKISEVEHPCSQDFTLKVPSSSMVSYQWYKDGIALIGEINSQLGATNGEGLYQVRLSSADECKLASFDYTIPVINTTISPTICEGETFTFDGQELASPGVYSASYLSADGCDSMVILELSVLGLQADTVHASIFEGEDYQIGGNVYSSSGEYLVGLQSDLNCDSLILLVLEYYNVFFPNIFSPNGDGINDYFNAYGSDDLLKVTDLKIFDRWGGLIYEGRGLPPTEREGWDGTRKGDIANVGVYVYVASVMMDDGKERQFSGSVLLFL